VTGAKPTKHLFAAGMLVATIEGATSTAVVHFIATDHLTGSNVVMSATGGVEEATDYNPYGDIRLDNKNTAFSEVRKFAGHEYDAADGLSYQGARYYDPALGRFLSEDPIYLAIGTDPATLEKILKDPQALNSYAYVRNNPLKYVDPDGKWFMEVLTGRQSFGAFTVELGDAGNALYSMSPVAATMMDHPVATGAGVGLLAGASYAAPAAIWAGAEQLAPGLTAANAIKAGIGAVLNVGSTALSAQVEGRQLTPGQYERAAFIGALSGVAPGSSVLAQGFVGALSNVGSQLSQGSGKNIDPFSVGISFMSSSAGAAMTQAAGPVQLPQTWAANVASQAAGWVVEVPMQTVNSALRKKK